MAHLDIAVHKALSKFGVHLRTTTPKVPYRETITKAADADYTHKKQTGGAGQYARVALRVEPIDETRGFESVSYTHLDVYKRQPHSPVVSRPRRRRRRARRRMAAKPT